MTMIFCGCASKPAPVPIPVKNDVIVTEKCPEPDDIPLPDLPISSLEPGSSNEDTVRAYAASVEILKGTVSRQKILLDSYRGQR